MDKELLSYLANIATVRNHINNLLSVGRGVIDQKTLHQVSARSSTLDKLFVQSFLSGRYPGQNGEPTVNVEDDDYVDISRRLREEKAKLAGIPVPTQSSKKTTPAQEALAALDEEDEEELEEEERPSKLSPKFSPPDDELAEVEALLADAEKQVSKKATTKTAVKKRSSRKTIA